MRTAAAAAAIVVVFLAVYLPDIGHGFIKDDFGWIALAGVDGVRDVARIFSTNVGFYRPLVSLTFAADRSVWDLHAFGYGLTNLALCLIDAWLLFAMARRLGLAATAALAAMGIWLMNPHGVNMALLWISGRTAICVVLFALAAAHAVLSRRPFVAGTLCLAALLCKEEAVALPALFTLFLAIDTRSCGERTNTRARFTGVTRDVWPLWAALVVYSVLRAESGAFGPATAPTYYRFSVSPLVVLRNIAEYADRAATFATVIVLVLLVATRWKRVEFSREERRTITLAAVWVPATYALTVFLPVRSSLYALFPSVGVALAAGAIASRASRADPQRFTRLAIALIVIVAVMIPVYRGRNERWVGLGDLSTRVLQAIEASTRGRSSGHLVLIDAPAERFNLDSTFGTLFPNAIDLTRGAAWTGEIVAPGATLPADATHVRRLVDGTLRPAR